jgi:hypothetical protein
MPPPAFDLAGNHIKLPHRLGGVGGTLNLALVGASQHFHHPLVRLLVCFEAIDAFGRPAMLEGAVKFNRRLLQLHASFQTVGRSGVATDKSVNLFFQVDKRLFHATATLNSVAEQSKLALRRFVVAARREVG